MSDDTGSDGGFCCLPDFCKMFKKKADTDQAGPIRQAVQDGNVKHQRHPTRIDDQGRPIDDQDQPISGSILHQRDAVGGDTPSIASQLATPADLYGQIIPMNVITPPSSAGGGGPSGGGTSTAAFGAGSSPAVFKGKGGDGTEKKDPGDGNLAAAANLI